MSRFSYTAIMVNGSKTKGIIEAQNLNDARMQLKGKKLRVIEIKEKVEGTLFTGKKKRN